MPTLPTLTINDQPTWDRVYAAFGGDPAKYKAWLKAQLLGQVQAYESQIAVQKTTDDLSVSIANST